MALIDALNSGMGLVDNLNRGAILNAQAGIAAPMAQQQLYTTMTNNKYLDAKDQLLNQQLSLGNTGLDLANAAARINNQYLGGYDLLRNQGLSLSNQATDIANQAGIINNQWLPSFNQQRLQDLTLQNQRNQILNQFTTPEEQQRLTQMGLTNAGLALQNQRAGILNQFLTPEEQQRLIQLGLTNAGLSLQNQRADALNQFVTPEEEQRLLAMQQANQATSITNKYLDPIQQARLQDLLLGNTHQDLLNSALHYQNLIAPAFDYERFKGMGLANTAQDLANQGAGINLQTLPALNAQRLRGLTLGNDASEINNAYLPGFDDARLTGMGLANLGTSINDQYLPLFNDQRLLGMDLSNQNQATTNLFQPQTLASAIQANQALASMRNQGATGTGGRAGAPQQADNAFLRSVAMDNPQLNNDPNLVYQAANAYRSGATALPDGTPLNAMSPETKGKLDTVVKYQNTTAGLNQQRFAATLDTLFKAGDPMIQSASKYSGILGSMRLQAARAAAQSGHMDPDYANYLKFTQQLIPSVASEMLRTGGASSTDSQKLTAIQSANPIALANNPKLAMQQWSTLKDIYGNIGKTLAKGPGQTQIDLQKGNSTTQWKMGKNGKLVRMN